MATNAPSPVAARSITSNTATPATSHRFERHGGMAEGSAFAGSLAIGGGTACRVSATERLDAMGTGGAGRAGGAGGTALKADGGIALSVGSIHADCILRVDFASRSFVARTTQR